MTMTLEGEETARGDPGAGDPPTSFHGDEELQRKRRRRPPPTTSPRPATTAVVHHHVASPATPIPRHVATSMPTRRHHVTHPQRRRPPPATYPPVMPATPTTPAHDDDGHHPAHPATSPSRGASALSVNILHEIVEVAQERKCIQDGNSVAVLLLTAAATAAHCGQQCRTVLVTVVRVIPKRKPSKIFQKQNDKFECTWVAGAPYMGPTGTILYRKMRN
ncbi:hypothetical protein BJ912DRAFT_1051701 [Pholiota molesta]|nr:hypothetical protein BJ912DRAFT_1051701 [Pholiota molesta]